LLEGAVKGETAGRWSYVGAGESAPALFGCAMALALSGAVTGER
jgi:hypothetical protein